MDACGYVYALSLDDGVIRYVGLTKFTPERRLRGHFKRTRSGSAYPVHRWIRKHGEAVIRVRTLCLAALADLPHAERWWIAALREDGYSLLNTSNGGEAVIGYVHSDEIKCKIGDALRGKSLSLEHRASLSAARQRKSPARVAADQALRDQIFTEETRAKLRAAHEQRDPVVRHEHAVRAGKASGGQRVGFRHSDESKEKMRAKRTGKQHSEETKAKMREAWERRRASAALRNASSS